MLTVQIVVGISILANAYEQVVMVAVALVAHIIPVEAVEDPVFCFGIGVNFQIYRIINKFRIRNVFDLMNLKSAKFVGFLQKC